MSLQKILTIVWRAVIGTAMCAFGWTSILALGWSYRLMQREALCVWWGIAEKHLQTRNLPRNQRTLTGFLKSLSWGLGHVEWPNWFARQRLRDALREEWPHAHSGLQKFRLLARSLTASLWSNLRLGALGLLNTWVLTLTPVLIWISAWHVVRLSATQQYPQPLGSGEWLAPLGAVLYALVMTVLPLAQARQAVTGDWRAFYDARVLLRLLRRYRGQCMGFALGYIAAGAPLAALLMWPDRLPAWAVQTPWLAGAGCFGAMTVLRVFVARAYARMIVDAVVWGEIELPDLHAREQELMKKLSVAEILPEEHSELERRWIDINETTAGNILGFSVVLSLWLGFAWMIFSTEQVRYNHHRNLINFPVVQLPAVNIPKDRVDVRVHLKDPDSM